MAKSRKQIWLAVIVVPPALLFAFIMGLYGYMNATKTPLHPDPTAVSSVTHSAPLPKWADTVEQARQLVRASLVEQNLPGLSVAVGADGEIVWAEGFGLADLEKRTPVAPATLFRVADASKALTSVAVGLLLEKDKLHLDDEIQVHVPEFPKKPWPVTLHQLMAQVAGARTDAGDEAPLSSNVVSDEGKFVERCERTVDGLQMDRFAERELLFEPGTKYSPSSYGWILVSAAVEAAADEPFFTFMRKQIFEPLGMRDTTIDLWTDPIPNRATFYFPRFAGDTRYGPQSVRQGDHSCYAGAGAFLSTPSDLVRFGLAVRSGKLLKPATIDMLQTPQTLASGEETGYGLGWRLETVPLAGHPTQMAGHGSKADFIGGTTYLMTFPERGIVVAVMTNTSFADTKSVALSIAQAFAEQGRSPARE
jgi:CubicO group peptidase (beta-lactamase class C family)